ncbi:MAG: hypothetical protein HY291_11040 [Planctomycetes bacterium]|nr:hypothetical protein [Planctomycetota bacterium]
MDPREGVLDPPPLWQQVAGFKGAKAASLSQRRSGLKRLVLWVTNWLSAVAAEHAGKPVDPGWEPARELAEALELPEPQLNRFCREQGGPSAREIWDRLRAEGFVAALRGEIERMLAGRKFKKTSGDRTPLEVMQTALRSARRDEGWTRVEFAWTLGFRNHARLNLAIFRALGQSVQRIEADILKDIANTWYISHSLCVILREQPSEAELEAMRKAALPDWGPPVDFNNYHPFPYALGCEALLDHLPKIPEGKRQYECVNARGDRVRVFANKEEVMKYFHAIGRDEAWLRAQISPPYTVDQLLDDYVALGMDIRDYMAPDVGVPE